MSGAILNLVRLNTADETAPEHDYTAGEIFERHEEIKLTDPDGCPCAIPGPVTFTNADYRYSFSTGDIGHQARQIRRDLTIAIDYVLNEKARRMEHWMHQRARVLFSPNIGRNTLFSFRPINIDGFTYRGLTDYAYDMTGNHRLYSDSVANPSLMWDRIKRRFIQKPEKTVAMITSYGITRAHHTPGGGGHAYVRAVRNLMVPSSPEGSGGAPGAGNSGWRRSGADSAQLTYTYKATAFGHPDCPGTIKIDYTEDVSSDRSVAVFTAFDSSHAEYQGIAPSGAGTMVVCVWLRGQLPDDSKLSITGSTGTTTRDVSGMTLDGWTPLIISRKESDWALSVPVVRLTLESADGIAGAIEIGPTMICQYAGVEYPAGEYWAPSQNMTSTSIVRTNSAFEFPAQGTLTASFYLPDWFGEDYAQNTTFGIAGNDDWGINACYLGGGVYCITVYEAGVDTHTTYAAELKPGEINTIAFAWSGSRQRIYCNGESLGDVNRPGTKITFGGNDSYLRIGYDANGDSMFPAVMLSLRIDEGLTSDEEAANLHLSLTDPIALQAAANARGRVFQITGIPQTLRSSAGGSHVLGNIKLQQVELQNWLTDPLNKEESVL